MDTLAASDHLAECEQCRARLMQLQESMLPRAPREALQEISSEDLVGWLDDELDPLRRREVAAALAHSAHLRAELSDLQSFREEMNALPARDHSAALPPHGETRERFFPRWTLPLAAAVMLSVIGIWWAAGPRRGADELVKLRDGDRHLAFTTDGRSPALAGVPERVSGYIAETIRTGRIELPPDIASMIGQVGTLAGPEDAANELRVVQPVGTAVRDRRPQFRWTSTAEASTYKVNVVEETSGALIASEELPPDSNTWEPREALPAGEVYQWEVQALRDGAVIANSPKPPQPEARFRIATLATLAELDEVKRASAGSHLVMGIANARAGLIDEALREFRLLAEQNPNAELPRRLIEQLETQRRAKL